MNKQITEDYCSFEIAQLLKEKGFDVPCRQAYFNGSLVDYTMYGFCDGELLDCPSQSLTLKWLREVHRKHICVRMRDFPTQYEIEVYDTKTGYLCHADFEHSFDSYEEAVEAALLYVLKNLI